MSESGATGEKDGTSKPVDGERRNDRRQDPACAEVHTDCDREKDEENDVVLSQALLKLCYLKQSTGWEDIVGLSAAKDELKDAIVLVGTPRERFQSNRDQLKGILLYGPPGVGKTLLGNAVATHAERQGLFCISVSAWELTIGRHARSKHFTKAMFESAQQKAPSIVFIEEFDALSSSRPGNKGGYWQRRRSEFLTLAERVWNETADVLLVCTSTDPWFLDDALLRLVRKRVYVPNPDKTARVELLRKNLTGEPHALRDEDFETLAAGAELYSGSDIVCTCREAMMGPVREATKATHFKFVPPADGGAKWSPCSPEDPGAEERSLMDMAYDRVDLAPVSVRDVEDGMRKVRPCVNEEILRKYEDFGQAGDGRGVAVDDCPEQPGPS